MSESADTCRDTESRHEEHPFGGWSGRWGSVGGQCDR